jgi:hypothetical protein
MDGRRFRSTNLEAFEAGPKREVNPVDDLTVAAAKGAD